MNVGRRGLNCLIKLLNKSQTSSLHKQCGSWNIMNQLVHIPNNAFKITTSLSNSFVRQIQRPTEIASLLLQQHLPPIDINIEHDGLDADDEFIGCRSISNYEDKRAGIYRSKGITVFIPEKCMLPGTRRLRIRELPKNISDDIRIIYYK